MMYQDCYTIVTYGLALGYVIGFTSWAIGFAIYSIIKYFKFSAGRG